MHARALPPSDMPIYSLLLYKRILDYIHKDTLYCNQQRAGGIAS